VIIAIRVAGASLDLGVPTTAAGAQIFGLRSASTVREIDLLEGDLKTDPTSLREGLCRVLEGIIEAANFTEKE